MTSTVEVALVASASSNHLNLRYSFEERPSSTTVGVSSASLLLPLIADRSVPQATEPVSPRSSEAKHAPAPLHVPRGPKLARPSTAPGLIDHVSEGPLDYRIPSPRRPYAIGPSSPTTLTASGETISVTVASKSRHLRRPSTAPDASRQPYNSGEVPRVRPSLAVHPPAAHQSNEVAPMQHIQLPFESLDGRAAVVYEKAASPSSPGLRDVLTPLSADMHPSTPRPAHNRRLSSLSITGVALHHSSSSGSSMDFGKFMPRSSTVSPKSASFPHTSNKTPSPIDVKRLLAKPATPLGNHLLATQSSTSHTVLPNSSTSPPPPDPLAPTASPNTTPVDNQHVPLDLTPPPRRQSVAIRPHTATATGSANPRIQSPEPQRRPTTSASAYVGEKTPSPFRTYASDGEAIGESPLPKRKRYFSTTRSPTQPPSPAAPMKEVPAEPTPLRLPKAPSAMTPAAAYALAYRSRASGVESEHRPADLSVSPWLEAEGHRPPFQLGDDGAPSEWAEFCSPRGFRKLRHKMSTKLSGPDRPTPAAGRATEADRPRKRSTSADPSRPRADVPRMPSGDSKRTATSKAAAALDTSRKASGDSKGTTSSQTASKAGLVRTSTEKPADVTLPLQSTTLPRSSRAEHKKRPSAGEQIWGIVRKLSAGNLRAPKTSSMERPAVPALPPEIAIPPATTKDKASLDVPIPRLAEVPPVPPIPIHFAKESPSSSNGHNDGAGEYLPSPSTGSPASSLHNRPSVDDLRLSRAEKRPARPTGPLSDHVQHILASVTTTSPSLFRSNSTKIPKIPSNNDNLLSFPSTSDNTPHRSTSSTPEPGRARKLARSGSRTSPSPGLARQRSTSTKSAPPAQSEKTPVQLGTRSKASQKEKARKLSISVPGIIAGGPLLAVAVQGDRSRSPSFVTSTSKNPGESPFGNQRPGKDTSHTSAPVAPETSPSSAGMKAVVAQPSASTLGVPASSKAEASPHSAAAYSFHTIRESARTPLSEEQKAKLWEDLLKKSEEAGGTFRPQLQFGPA